MAKWIIGAAAAALLAVHLFTRHAMTALLAKYAPELTPPIIFLDALLVSKLGMMLCILMTVFGTLIGLIGLILALLRQGVAARIIVWALTGIGIVGVALGAMGAVYTRLATLRGMKTAGISDPAIVAPSNAETLLSLSMGSFTGFLMLALGLLIMLAAQWRAAKGQPA